MRYFGKLITLPTVFAKFAVNGRKNGSVMIGAVM